MTQLHAVLYNVRSRAGSGELQQLELQWGYSHEEAAFSGLYGTRFDDPAEHPNQAPQQD